MGYNQLMAGTFGTITNPLKYGNVNTGLPTFISNIIQLLVIGAGLFALFNFIFAGYSYLSAAGDTKKIEAALSSINMSILGLLIMASAVIIIGILSFVLFGSPTYILAPNIVGKGTI